MKKLLIILGIALVWGACHEEKVGVYSLEEDYVYSAYYSSRYSSVVASDNNLYFWGISSMPYVNSTILRDTVYIRVDVAGMPRDYDRHIKLEQFNYEYQGRDTAVAGVNYVAFDDPEVEALLVVPKDSVAAEIPVIVTYDPASAGQYQSFILAFRLVESEDFKVLETNPDLTVNSARTNFLLMFSQQTN